jgi:hypothetical protein
VEELPIEENAEQCRRLAALVDRLGDDDLVRTSSTGWTVSMMLANLAFWDRWAAHLIHRWRTGEMPPPTVASWYDDAMNTTLLDQWRALPPRTAARLAIEAAQAVDHEVAHAETPVIMAITAAHEGHLIHRHRQRREALDQIEQIVGRRGRFET